MKEIIIGIILVFSAIGILDTIGYIIKRIKYKILNKTINKMIGR